MDERKNHNKHYTYADIRNYLEGKMSLDEMYTFEKAVMDDPFLADALDGYMALHSEQGKEKVQDDLKELGQKLATVSNKKSARGFVIPFWAKSAAAVILVVIIGYLTDQLLLNKKSGQGSIAKKEEQSITQPESPAKNEQELSRADSSTPVPGKNQSNLPASALDKKAVSKRRSESATERPVQQKESASKKKSQADSNNITAAGKAEIAPTAEANAAKLADKDLAPRQRSLSASAVVPNDQVFRGVVIDANSMPVQGAVIKLMSSSKVVTTDKLGEFNLGIKDNDEKIHLEVNAVGYQPRLIEVARENPGRNIIQLSPDSNSVKEMVVSEYREKQLKESKSDMRNSIDLNVSLAVPAGGWPAFYDYMNTNKKINTADSTKKGTEIISFQVDKGGKLSAFRAEQSISKAHYAEAIRLIREGPGWTCLKGKKQRITIYINFN
jgi:hypothetical protein